MFKGYDGAWHTWNFKGEKNRNAKVTNQEAQQIRELAAHKIFTQTQLAEIYGIAQGNISQIVNNKAYRDETNTEEIQ